MLSLFKRYLNLPREIHILFFARVINSVGAFVFPLMTLILTDKMGMSESEAGGYITVLTLVQGVAMTVGGKLADVLGRRQLIIICSFLGSAAYIACGIAGVNGSTVYLIAAASMFYSISHPAMDAMAMDITNPGNRKEAFSLLYMGFNLGFAVGPMIGGFLFKEHLPFLFIGDAATTIISTLLIMFFVKETLSDGSHEDYPELERHEAGSVFDVLLRRRNLLVFAIALFLFEFSYMQWSFSVPIQTKDLFANGISFLGLHLEDGAAVFGLLASFNGLLVIILTPLITYLSRKFRPLRGMAISGMLYAAAFLMLVFIRELPFFFVSMFILTTGEVFGAIESRAYIANHTPASHRGRLNSLINILSGAGRVLSPAIIGYVIAGGNMDAGWIVISAVAVAGTAVIFALMGATTRRERTVAPAAEEAGQAE